MKPNTDKLLKEWSDRQPSDPVRIRALEDRILAAYRAGTAVEDHHVHDRDHRTIAFDLHKRNLLCFVAGIAATLLVVSTLHFGNGRQDLAPLLREEGGLFAGRQPAMSRVFCETERLFGTNLQWVAQSGKNAELGLVDSPGRVNEKAMIVHLSVVARRAGDNQGWQRIWQADVVARADGVVELTPDGIPGNHVALWLHRLDHGNAFVESRLELCRPVRMEAETREILKFGNSRDVTRIRSGDTEYLLLQTVAPAGGAS